MPKPRSPDRDKAFQIYKEHNGDIPLVDIALKCYNKVVTVVANKI